MIHTIICYAVPFVVVAAAGLAFRAFIYVPGGQGKDAWE